MSKEDSPIQATGEKDIEQRKSEDADVIPTKTKPWWKFGGKDYSFVSVNAGYATTASSSETNLYSGDKLGRHVYETEDAKEIYKPIEGYEGAHRFDPSLEWSPAEEKRLVKIVSLDISFSARHQKSET